MPVIFGAQSHLYKGQFTSTISTIYWGISLQKAEFTI